MIKYKCDFWFKENEVSEMRFIWTLIWALLLSNMAFYVLSSMQNAEYNPATATLIGVVLAVAAAVIGDGLLKEPDSAQ
jgi:hypothetical protein